MERKKKEYNRTVHQLFIDFKKVYISVTMNALYYILTEFGIPMKLVWIIKMYLNETYSKVLTGKHLSDTSSIQKFWNKDMLYRHCFLTLI
jgi:hypothetical protein